MASLDEELARFEAELKSLEASAPQVESKKRTRDADHDAEAVGAKKRKEARTKDSDTKVVVAAAPKVYVAPPRPAPVKTSYGGASASQTDSLSRVESSSGSTEATDGSRGALSGFPMGTTGEAAAARAIPGVNRQVVQRVDMVTGQLLSAEEQHLMNLQQSVYEYDPNRALSSQNGSGYSGNGGGSYGGKGGAGNHGKRNLRMAGGEVWEDPTLADWPDNDFRLFCGDLGNEVTDELLAHAFSRYPSFQRARVVRDKYSHKTRGYGFISFGDPFDCAKAMREMNGRYIGNRPVKIHKSKWQDRNLDVAKKKKKQRKKDRLHLFE